jgi:hypothetical protein
MESISRFFGTAAAAVASPLLATIDQNPEDLWLKIFDKLTVAILKFQSTKFRDCCYCFAEFSS